MRSLIVVGDHLWTVYANMTIAVSNCNNMPDGAGLPFTLKHNRSKDKQLPVRHGLLGLACSFASVKP